MERRPEYSLYVQDDWRATSKLTLNLGLRWDVYPPWREDDDRQSNFDETTGQFVVASDNASIAGVDVGRYLQTYSKGDFGPRLGFAYDLTGDGKTLIRGGWGTFWNFSPGGTSSSKAQNQPFLQSTALTPTPSSLRHGPAAGTGFPTIDPDQSRRQATRGRSSTSTSATRYAQNWNLNVQRGLGTNYWWRSPTSARAAVRWCSRWTSTRRRRSLASPTRTSTGRSSRWRPRVRTLSQSQQHRDARLQRAAAQVPAAIREQFLVPELVHVRASPWTSRRTTKPASRTPTTSATTTRRPTTTSGTRSRRAGSTSCRGRRRRSMAAGRSMGFSSFARDCRSPSFRRRTCCPTGTQNRPNRICDGSLDNPTVDKWFDTSCFVAPTDTTGTFGDAGRNILRGPGQFNIDASLIKNTQDRAHRHRDPRSRRSIC